MIKLNKFLANGWVYLTSQILLFTFALNNFMIGIHFVFWLMVLSYITAYIIDKIKSKRESKSFIIKDRCIFVLEQSNYDHDSFKIAFDKFLENKKEVGVIYGEIFNSDRLTSFDITGSNISNISHYLENMELINGKIYADIHILSTIPGKTLRNMVKSNIPFHFKPRVLGLHTKVTEILTFDAHYEK